MMRSDAGLHADQTRQHKSQTATHGRANCAAVLGEPVDSVVWMANALSAEGLGLSEGQLVPIGTWTGLHFITGPAHVAADFGPLGKVEIDFR
jgi:2-keto-4-pentenoate hydratase